MEGCYSFYYLPYKPICMPSDLLSNTHVLFYDCSLNGAWLPAKLPEYKEEEHKVISSALQDMFGDLRGVQFCINHKSCK